VERISQWFSPFIPYVIEEIRTSSTGLDSMTCWATVTSLAAPLAPAPPAPEDAVAVGPAATCVMYLTWRQCRSA
jgi:hypothetical protein